MANPVRIYVLYHPESSLARFLVDHLYDWFRMPSLEGIPVYVRSAPIKGGKVPIIPSGRADCLEYLVPLVDAHMVRDVAWHDYLVELSGQCLQDDDWATCGWVMFPVALDGTAFNLPGPITQRNFVRLMAASTSTVSGQKPPLDEPAVMGVLKDLTEAMSLDLNIRIFPEQMGRKLKIFISYARADGAEVPKAIRDYISGQTQCDAFFDENDIGFGSKYGSVLGKNAGEQARALIVVAGDHYAERPICRWEIRKFTEPDLVPLDPAKPQGRRINAFHPVMVLSTLNGVRITRVVAELGQAPTLRWEAGREMTCFSVLMRTVLFGARNILAARKMSPVLGAGMILNRLPGPIALQRLLSENGRDAQGPDESTVVHYPGNGLPLLELHLLESTFSKIQLAAFGDVARHLPEPLKNAMDAGKRPLHEKVIGISYGFSKELESMGYLPQHLEEALIYLLRPLLRLGADIMYGGKLPKKEVIEDGRRNMTLSLMNLVNDELSINSMGGVDEAGRPRLFPSRLFNPTAWPNTKKVTPEHEAALINSCSVIQTLPEHVGLIGKEPDEETSLYMAWKAICMSRNRQLMAKGYDCPVPGNAERKVEPAATIFGGGRLTAFSGCMPGILDEFAWAMEYQRPFFLLGGFGGATRAIVDVLLGVVRKRSGAFMSSFYEKEEHYASLLKGYHELEMLEDDYPEARLKSLWNALTKARKTGHEKLCRNGLNEEDNRRLMTTDSTNVAVHLVWKGLSALQLSATKSDSPARPKTAGAAKKVSKLRARSHSK